MDPVEAGPWLLGRPQQLIFLTGLDPANKKSHAVLVNSFSSSPDKPPLNLRLLSGELEFPPKPEKLNSTKGIIRREWPTKYLERVPSLIVLFLDLDWDHPSWAEKKTEAESKCASIRASCRKDSQLAVVLIQERNCVDDSKVSERATELCQTCNLSAKQLFVIPIVGDIQGYTMKLQTAFHELAQGFYQQKLRTIRARSIPNNSPNLVVRQLFKLAFLSELRQDTHTALRNYRLAYEQCKENIEHWDGIDIFEWRSVVGLLNYKMCELCFLHNTAVEAINQMRKHQAAFFNINPGLYPTVALASIEHQLWKAKQCWHFAQLFEQAVQNGLTALATLNPGTHLDMAASIYSLANKEIAILKAANPISGSYPSPDPLANETSFFGQRPWRVGLNGVATADIELNASQAIIQRLVVNYEGVVSLLNASMNQFKRYGCTRMQKKVMNEMADVYYTSGDCAKALQLWSLVVRDQIPPAVKIVILTKACWAAYSIPSVKDFIWAALQLSTTEASVVDGLLSVFSGKVPALPFFNAGISEEQANTYQAAWAKVLAEPQFFTLQCSRINIFLDIKVFFLTTATVQPNSKIPVYVIISSQAFHVFNFSSVKVYFEAVGKKKQDNPMIQSQNMVVEPGRSVSFIDVLDLANANFSEGDTISVSNVCLEVGQKSSNMFGQLEFDGVSIGNRVKQSTTTYGVSSFTISTGPGGLVSVGSTAVDCLVGEVAECMLCLQNTTSVNATDIKLEFKRMEQSSTAASAVLFVDMALQSDQAIPCQSVLESSQTMAVPVRFSAQLVGEMELSLELSYLPENGSSRVTNKIAISVKANDPFFATSGILTMNGLPVTSLLNYSEHILKVDVTANADITITNVEWLLADVITSISSNENEKILEDSLSKNDMVNYCHPIMVNVSGDDTEVPLGRIAIEWKRKDSSFCVRSVVALCRLPVLPCPVYISANVLDSPAIVHQSIRVQYIIGSRLEEAVDMTATFDLSDTYMFCGDKRITFRLLPGSTRVINVVVMALSADRLPFPRIALKSSGVDDHLLQHTLRTLPATMFVLPISKTCSNSEA